MSYGNTIQSTTGTELFGFLTLDALGIIEGVDGYGTSPEELQELELQFKNSTKTVMVIPEFEDIQVRAHIAYEYSLYQGEIKERVSVKRFYRVGDNATSSEIVNETEAGVKHASDLEKYADKVSYKDGLEAEAVAAWKLEKSGNGSPSAPNPSAAKSAGFAKPAGFGRPSTAQ